MRPLISLLAAFCLAAVAVLTSCSIHSKWPGPTGQETRFVAETAKHAQGQFALGRFKRALELYSTAYDKYHYPGLRRGYARLGEQIRNAADAAYQRGDFAEAGSDYGVLFGSGITTRDFAGSLSFDDDYLGRQIKGCSKALMESGLMNYRAEKLDDAIAIWKKILQFDPGNKTAQNAYDTATAQLQQLKHIK
jgi:tetratricopeptide (TPR) repeat protein